MSERACQTVGIQMYGVRLNLACDNAELVEYLDKLVPGHFGPPAASPDLLVTAHWIEEHRERGVTFFPNTTPLNGLGKRMQMKEDELVWTDTHRDKDLQLRFRRHENKWLFDVAYCYQPSEKKLNKYPDFKLKKFFDLLRYLVYFPIAWHLERTRNWSLIHASAVAENGGALLIAGPGGAGKTTTCLALVAQAGMTLVTENLLFTDGERIFPLIEPLRLTEDSLRLLNNELRGLQPIELSGGLRNKSMYWLPGGPSLRSAKPVAVFVPQFSPASFVRSLRPALASELIGAVNRLTLELNDYYWYTSALDVLWPQSGNAQRQLDVLRRLTESTPCYTLGIDRSAGVQAVVDQILANLNGSDVLTHQR
ncbi:hypothetical protein MJD09_15850 [bacterium]|nr:hypothetical protein [bacterium]